MSRIRVQVITRRANDIPRDFIVNTLHFRVDPVWDPLVDGPNWTSLATDVRNVFLNLRQGVPVEYGAEVKVYDLDQDLPREVKGRAAWDIFANRAGTPGPREVALCLSFRGDRNIPRKRGRIFLGPYNNASCSEKPSNGLMANAVAIATGLAGIGGVDIDWCVRSTFPKQAGDQGGTMVPIQASWCDDEWDTIRSRGFRSTIRTTGAHSE
jgi:hypothetical protein